MSQTDRQTRQQKATWWMITSNLPGAQCDVDALDSGVYPAWVKRVYGGKEEAAREHRQSLIQCHRQVRFSAIKAWLPKSNIQVARDSDAAQGYVLKGDTAVGEKEVITNSIPYYDNMAIMLLLAAAYRNLTKEHMDTYFPTPYDEKKWSHGEDLAFWECVRNILRETPQMVGALCKPDILRAWKHTKVVWLEKHDAAQRLAAAAADDEGYSITPESDLEDD